ncbi:hypothetical protein B296_00003501 [Ensete ventricosum]|uniref:Uncharacterized protein n=1 Tax=Ensete ventricosum TaxID=4639 RepID=A0A426YZ28_ENSVE|nr:hypothetical protein B296_00003501 [Ensete ventricosum]
MAVDFDGYISVVEKEQMILLEPSSKIGRCCKRAVPSKIRSDDSKHRLLCFRSQCSAEVDAKVRRDLALATEEASSYEGVETEVDDRDAVDVPVAALAATDVRMVSAARWRPAHCGIDKGSSGQERPLAERSRSGDGIAERGRRITPSKDDDEQPQEGAMCGRWGGAAAMDRLLQKIGDDEGCREMYSDLERNRHWRQREELRRVSPREEAMGRNTSEGRNDEILGAWLRRLWHREEAGPRAVAGDSGAAAWQRKMQLHGSERCGCMAAKDAAAWQRKMRLHGSERCDS